ncbi:DUF6480 family protein [Streptomyces sp. NPDC050803]|uniref:DUF6480 family protein n=1 Tax=unclassified Streptomyces TaxID=2593676 RepID=UPI003430182B
MRQPGRTDDPGAFGDPEAMSHWNPDQEPERTGRAKAPLVLILVLAALCAAFFLAYALVLLL